MSNKVTVTVKEENTGREMEMTITPEGESWNIHVDFEKSQQNEEHEPESIFMGVCNSVFVPFLTPKEED